MQSSFLESRRTRLVPTGDGRRRKKECEDLGLLRLSFFANTLERLRISFLIYELVVEGVPLGLSFILRIVSLRAILNLPLSVPVTRGWICGHGLASSFRPC